MSTVNEYMIQDHRSCDKDFAAMEQASVNGDYDEAEKHWEKFFNALERHLQIEEELLFPAFENATGNAMGPTQMMRMEHQQMRDMVGMIQKGIQEKNKEKLFGYLETMMILMQQHNMKEEQILYPMIQNVLTTVNDKIIEEIESFTPEI